MVWQPAYVEPKARAEITSHFGASAGRADARRRDEVDVGHRRGAATAPIRALRRRAPSGCGPQGCGAQPWGPAAKCEVISARALRSEWRGGHGAETLAPRHPGFGLRA